MPSYVLAYHGGAGMGESEEDQQRLMAAWGTWFGGLGESLVDGGNAIGAARTIAPSGSVSEGGGINPLTGYSIITADDLGAAVGIAKSCPVLEAGGSVEVAETINM